MTYLKGYTGRRMSWTVDREADALVVGFFDGPTQPGFDIMRYCQHEHPKGTCHGKYSMCSSSGKRHSCRFPMECYLRQTRHLDQQTKI